MVSNAIRMSVELHKQDFAIEKLEAENKRLRDALEECVEWITKVTSYDASTLKCMEAARQALMQQSNVQGDTK